MDSVTLSFPYRFFGNKPPSCPVRTAFADRAVSISGTISAGGG